jgi:excinuclease ABC subunit B
VETISTKKRFSPLLEGLPEVADPSAPSSSGERSETRGPKDDPSSGSTRGPIVRGKVGVGSYEEPGDAKQQKRRTKGKTGRPGR